MNRDGKVFDDRKKKKNSACLQFLRRPECYNKLLLSRAGRTRAGSKRKTEQRGQRTLKTESELGRRGLAGGGGRRGPVNRERSVRLGRAGSARAGARRCPFKPGGAGRLSAAVIGAAGSLTPRARPGGVGWSPLRFDKVLATQ